MDALNDAISLLHIHLSGASNGSSESRKLKAQLAVLERQRLVAAAAISAAESNGSSAPLSIEPAGAHSLVGGAQTATDAATTTPSKSSYTSSASSTSRNDDPFVDSLSAAAPFQTVTESNVRHAVEEEEEEEEEADKANEKRKKDDPAEEKVTEDAEEIVTPGAKEKMKRESEKMLAIMRNDAEKCFGSAADRERQFNLHEFRHHMVSLAQKMTFVKEMPVVYASVRQQEAWFPDRAYRTETNVMSFEPKRIMCSDPHVDSIKKAITGRNNEPCCPGIQLCDIRRAHCGLYTLKRPQWNQPVGLARQSDINTLLVDFECMVEDEAELRLRERDLVRIRNVIRDKIADPTYDYATLTLFVERMTDIKNNESVQVTIAFKIPLQPIQHVFGVYLRCHDDAQTQFNTKPHDKDDAYVLQPLRFPLSSWYDAPPTLNACLGRYLHNALDATAHAMRKKMRSVFTEEQWNYMVFQHHATITHRRTNDPSSESASHASTGHVTRHNEEETKELDVLPSSSSSSVVVPAPFFEFAPSLDDIRCGLTRDMRVSEMTQWLRDLLTIQFESSDSEPFGVSVVSDATWKLDSCVFESWSFDVDLQPLLGPFVAPPTTLSMDAIQRYACDRLLVVLRLLFVTIRSAQKKYVPCGPWELFIRFSKFSQLTCIIAVNRSNRMFAEEDLRSRMLSNKGTLSGSSSSSSTCDTLTMGGLEQAVTRWFHKTYTDPVLPVFWLMPDELKQRFQDTCFTRESLTVQLCRVAEILDDTHTVFTEAHMKLAQDTIDDVMRTTKDPTALSLVFLQQQCSTNVTLGVHWIILLQVVAYARV